MESVLALCSLAEILFLTRRFNPTKVLALSLLITSVAQRRTEGRGARRRRLARCSWVHTCQVQLQAGVEAELRGVQFEASQSAQLGLTSCGT